MNHGILQAQNKNPLIENERVNSTVSSPYGEE
jgi:hypothetical protein